MNSWICVLTGVTVVSGLPLGRFDSAEAKKCLRMLTRRKGSMSQARASRRLLEQDAY